MLARQILNDNRIALATRHVSTIDRSNHKADAYSNILHTSEGKKANLSAGGKSVDLDIRMLRAIVSIADKYGYVKISEFAGGTHSATSDHYRGKAVDITMMGSIDVSDIKQNDENYNMFKHFVVESLGANPNQFFGPGYPGHSNHFHLAWA
jgi:hypothetical protein